MSAAHPASAKTPRGEGFLSWLPVDEFFSLDLRSLAVFRIGLGFLVLLEWINRWVDLRAHYTDDGVVPRQVLGQLSGPFSIFMVSGEAWFVAMLMGIGCVFGLLMMLGWRTQLVTLISWFLIIGIHGRCFLIIQGGDFVMRLLLFWAIFLPLGGCYSLDALRGPPDREWRPRYLSPGSAALILQMAFIYWFAAAWKSDAVWRRDFTAVYMSLSLEEFSSGFGRWLLNFPTLLKGLSAATMILETFGPALLFMPFAQGPLRFLTIVAFGLFHIGLSVCLALGNFPWVCCIGWCALLPTWFWDQLEARLRSPVRAGMTIYYDGANFWHRKLVNAARMFLLLYEAKALPAGTGEQHAGRLREGGPWVVVDHTGLPHVQFDAMLYMTQVSPLYWPLAYVLLWQPFRELGAKTLSWLANRRPRWVAAKVDRSPYPGAQLGGLFQNTMVIFFIVYVFFINLTSLDDSAHKTQFHKFFPIPMASLALSLGLDQSWGLFAPFPGREDGWYVVPAELANGKVVDIYSGGGPVTRDKPPLMSITYANSRWRKLQMNLTYPQHYQFRHFYCRWLYNEWNRCHGPDERIVRLHLFFRYRRTEPDRQVTDFHDKWLYHYAEYPVWSIAAVAGLPGGPAMLTMAMRPLMPPILGEEPPSPLPQRKPDIFLGEKPQPLTGEKSQP